VFRSAYDIVVVGARCSGASLAILLARAGASVLVVERDTLPSDYVLSTHTIHPPGIDVLDDLGVGAAVRAVTPPTRVMRLVKNDAALDLPFAEGREEYCPRRKRLDTLLQDAARDAGADLHDRTRVTGLLVEHDRVAGVRVEHDGRAATVRARLVVGADGRHSTVAKLAAAEEYLGYDAPRAMYWAYWDAPAAWGTDAYPFGMCVVNRRGRIRVVFQTDHRQLLVGSLPPVSEVPQWKHDPLRALQQDLAADPLIRALVAGRAPDGPVRGTVRERYFFRQAAGPGWALVGDAGHHKEFVIGDGMTEALLQVRALAPAIAEGTDEALVRWWRARDVAALPYFCFGQDEGRLGEPFEVQRLAFEHTARDPQLLARLARTLDHGLSPYAVFPGPAIVRWVAAAALRGRVRVVPEFVRMARRQVQVNRELARRRALLAACVSSSGTSARPVAPPS
jgi:menaquinone-9 beta-reductase